MLELPSHTLLQKKKLPGQKGGRRCLGPLCESTAEEVSFEWSLTNSIRSTVSKIKASTYC